MTLTGKACVCSMHAQANAKIADVHTVMQRSIYPAKRGSCTSLALCIVTPASAVDVRRFLNNMKHPTAREHNITAASTAATIAHTLGDFEEEGSGADVVSRPLSSLSDGPGAVGAVTTVSPPGPPGVAPAETVEEFEVCSWCSCMIIPCMREYPS